MRNRSALLLAGLLVFTACSSGDSGPTAIADVIPGDLGLQVSPGGQDLTDHPTLDVCGGSFPSEADRVERLQEYEGDVSFPTLSTEVVRYSSSDTAAQAFAEINAAVLACVPGTSAGDPPVSWEVHPLDDSELKGLAKDRLGVHQALTDNQGQTYELYAVYQHRGDLLAIVYGQDYATTLQVAARASDAL
jgi:hypothetical protein